MLEPRFGNKETASSNQPSKANRGKKGQGVRSPAYIPHHHYYSTTTVQATTTTTTTSTSSTSYPALPAPLPPTQPPPVAHSTVRGICTRAPSEGAPRYCYLASGVPLPTATGPGYRRPASICSDASMLVHTVLMLYVAHMQKNAQFFPPRMETWCAPYD